MPRRTTLRSSLRRIENEKTADRSVVTSNNKTGVKRKGSVIEPPVSTASKTTKRAAFGDITNAVNDKNKTTLKTQVKKGLTTIRSNFTAKKPASSLKRAPVVEVIKNVKKSEKRFSESLKQDSTKLLEEEDDEPGFELAKTLSRGSSFLPSSQGSNILSSQDDFKSLGETSLSDSEDYKSAEESLLSDKILDTPRPVPPAGVIDFDLESANDPNQCASYAMDIFNYYKSREPKFAISDYMKSRHHPEVSEAMRSILVDWLVEVQESFELNHETLYTAVKIFDLYLSLEKVPVKRDELQLIGATACLIACKVDERLPPPLDDFVYVCDDAYSREQIIETERIIIQKVDFDVGYPLSYRFLRRYGRVCKVTMPVLTLARYILETSLMEYELNIVGTSESKLAAAAMVLAFKIHGIQGWVETLKYYSGYSPAKDLSALVNKLFLLISKPHRSNLQTIRQKYSHVVFHHVALVKLPEEIIVDEQ